MVMAQVLEPGSRQGGAARVLERRDITPDLMVLRVSRPAGFAFVPGQHARLGIGDMSHSYSIASAPSEDFLEFCIELVPNGMLTPKLWRLRAGDAIDVGRRAKGGFVLDTDADHHFMLATVTGIAPFCSMLRHELQAHVTGRHFYVLHGASFADELVLRVELQALAQGAPWLEYVPAVSRPADPRNAGWSGAKGRLPALADEHAERFGLELGKPHVYACGHPAMVAAITARFETMAVPVSSEAYWKV
jgi:ferredoxin-NADP reductase